ncbi:AAA family ATPase, partial [Mesorhizobium sp. B2-6-7]|uniref:KGGVGR-motif variant AAA ATPase n=1 Tax=Mesorhizobium sp. B2-6-7 TaxID=2589910 RepID=UPI001125E903
MFAITFYSYKGGVGRTMALVNAAAELTRRGRKVLIVDFYLEAQGVSTYTELSQSEYQPGLVEYISEYMSTYVAPRVSDFIIECSIKSQEQVFPIWVFPAGNRDKTYSARLSAIDWQGLYEFQSGYLLFEDFRQQLKEDARGFDYILIDSRTGHTDVGGICTRQLADAVVLMFFPNLQNITGLQSIVEEIRLDKSRRSKDIGLLFCPSNVPDLDDELDILKTMLDLSKDRLGYDDSNLSIEHYGSLFLVDQSIFVIDRPKTKLASQYRALVDSVVQLNIEDGDGAMFYLRKVRRNIEYRSQDPGLRIDYEIPLSEMLSALDRIGRIHKTNGKVSWELAAVYRALGNFTSEFEALSAAIDADYDVPKARLRRAFNLLSQSKPNEARQDLLQVLGSRETTAIDLTSAIQVLKSIDDKWSEIVEEAPALEELSSKDLGAVADVLMSDVNGLRIAYRLIEKVIRNRIDGEDNDTFDNDLVLILIGTGHFEEAMLSARRSREEILEDSDIQVVFNYAMAEWGYRKSPSKDMFARVRELEGMFGGSEDANFMQCMALTAAVLDEVSFALETLERAKRSIGPGRIFSCWQYLYVGKNIMRKDIEEMQSAFK